MTNIFYSENSTYIDDLLHEDRNISTQSFSFAEAMALSIKLGCSFDYDLLTDEDIREAREILENPEDTVIRIPEILEDLLTGLETALKEEH